MLTREQIAYERRFAVMRDEPSEVLEALDMALALLDVAYLVPGEGDVAERVSNALDVRDERIAVIEAELAKERLDHISSLGQNQALCEKLAKVEAEALLWLGFVAFLVGLARDLQGTKT